MHHTCPQELFDLQGFLHQSTQGLFLDMSQAPEITIEDLQQSLQSHNIVDNDNLNTNQSVTPSHFFQAQKVFCT